MFSVFVMHSNVARYSDDDLFAPMAVDAMLAVKTVKLDNRLSFPISVSNLSLDVSSDKDDDVFGTRPSSGPEGLTSLTKYSSGTNLTEDGSLTTLASSDTSF